MDIDIDISKIPVNLLLCVKVVSGHWHVHLPFTIYVYTIKTKITSFNLLAGLGP